MTGSGAIERLRKWAKLEIFTGVGSNESEAMDILALCDEVERLRAFIDKARKERQRIEMPDMRCLHAQRSSYNTG